MRRISLRTGFTLVELLVVMAIIMILAGISMPVYHKYRSSAYSMKCKANLRAIGSAFYNYQTAYNGWLPYALDNNKLQTDDKGRAIKWKYELSFYLGNYSPKQKKLRSYPLFRAFFDPVKGNGGGNYMLSKAQFGGKIQVKDVTDQWVDYYEYGDEYTVDAEGRKQWSARVEVKPTGFMPYDSWKAPERAAIITESKDPKIHRDYAKTKTGVINVDYRHNGMANVLFLDMHVQEYEKADKKWFELFDKKVLENVRMRQID